MNTTQTEEMALRFVAVPKTLADLGGFVHFKRWAKSRAAAFSDAGLRYGLHYPKGILLVGVHGTGKSLAAKAIASAWDLPLYMLDMGAVFGSFVGQTEKRLREVFSYAEEHAPCVVWIDEIERGLAVGVENDTGITARVIQGMLTWLQERRAPVFVAATANQLFTLPRELVRPGRFDRIWGVDLPGQATRIEIFKIHLAAHRRNPAEFALDFMSEISYGLTGAEIELAISNAFFDAFDERRNVTGLDIAREIKEVIPTSKKFAKELEVLREWMSLHAVPVD